MKTQSFNNTLNEIHPEDPQPQERLASCFPSKESIPSAFASGKYHNRSIIFDQLLCLAVVLHFVLLGVYVLFVAK